MSEGHSNRVALLTSTALCKGPAGWLTAGLLAGAILAVAAVPHPAHAFNVYDGEGNGNNLEINLNTTVSYQNILRVNSPSATLTSPTGNPNGSEGDLAFQHGVVSNEFEILPILDIKDGDYGAHFSGEAYINTSYLHPNQNDQPDTLNPSSVAKNTDFTSATRNVEGLNARVLDYFVYGTQHFGDQTVTLKVGQQTLLWGQSLFFSGNGIAAGQAPIDVITAQNTPNAETQQIILPVPQVVLTYQPNNILTLQGYYQFQWVPYNLQAVGAYYSSTDVLDKGGQRLIVGPNTYFYRTKDLRPPQNNGQFGLSAQFTLGDYDLGFYGLRYDSKTPTLYLKPGAPVLSPSGLYVGSYNLVYPRNIQIYGSSLSTNVGPAQVSLEISGRRNMPLVTGANISTAANPGNANSNPLYPVGSTFAAQASTVYVSPGIPLDPGGVSVAAEIAANHVLSIDRNKAALSPNRTPTAAQLQFVVTPTYYDVWRVLPNLQLGFPIGLEWNFYGRSEIDSTENHGTGVVNVGIQATYQVTWIASITYQDYFGKASTTYNPLADRGYLAFNIQHSF